MPRQSKGPRLYLLKGRIDARSGKPLPDVWFVRDGQVRFSTGCVDDGSGRAPEAAERALADHIAQKWTPAAASPESRSDPTQVLVAEVLTLYAREKAPRLADPSATGARLAALTAWWADRPLADVTRTNCEAYIRDRSAQPIASFKDPAKARLVTVQGARRELEDLSAAIGWWDDEHHLTRRPRVILPEKPESSRDALTRSQAAALLLAAMGRRKGPDGRWRRLGGSAAANRAHLRRFVLLGLYTGSRPGIGPKLLWSESPSQAFVDLEDGWIYRRGRKEKDHKTKKRPVVRMPPRLWAHMRRWAEADRKLNERRKAAELPPVATVLHHGGRPIAGKIRRGFAGIVRDAGLPAEITPHWLRHTAATWLMEADAKPWEAAQYMGMTVKTLEDCYGHRRPGHQADAARLAGRGGR